MTLTRPAALAAGAALATGAAVAEPAREATAAFFERYNAQDVPGMVALFEPGATVTYVPMDLSGPVEEIGPQAWGGLIEAFPDLAEEVRRVHVADDGRRAFADVVITGTQAQDAFGIENQGRSYELRHLFVVGVNEAGRIDEMTAFFDAASWYRQLGRAELDAGEG